jgi:hypothetical protein
MCFSFFKSDKPKDDFYYKLGGPRSFYKYDYKLSEIIFIGECHVEIDEKSSKLHLEILKKKFEKNPTIKLFLEGEKNTDSPDFSNLSFIDCINKADLKEINVIPSDIRNIDDGLYDFFSFLRRLSKVQDRIADACKKNKLDRDPMMFSNDHKFVQAIEDLSKDLKRDFNLPSFYKLIDDSLKMVIELEKKYSLENIKLGAYLGNCICNLCNAIDSLSEIEKQHALLSPIEKDMKDYPMIDICIDLMKYTNKFDPVNEFFDIINLYVLHFYDATLATGIWNEINNDESKNIIMVVAGQKHIDHLSELFNQIAEPIISIKANNKGKVIPPHKMAEYLDVEKREDQQKYCLIM